MTRQGLIALTLLTTLASLGCYRPGYARQDPIADEDYPRVVTYGILHNDFFYSPPVITPQEGNRPMSVSVDVRRKEPRWDYDLPIQYRFIFLDGAGVPLESDPAWQWRNVPSRVKVNLQASAPDIGASDWRLELRKDKVEKKHNRYY